MKLYNIVKVYTATTGTGTVTLGSAVPSFITFATAGVTTGSTVSYAIEDGNNREVGTGVYTSGAETLTRNVVTSTNSNNLITLSGNAVVFITGLAADLSSATANTASTLVLRDGSGNFAAGAATLSSVVFNGSSSGTTTVQASATASGTLTLPAITDTLIGKATSDTLTNKTYDTAGTGNVLKINGTQVSAVTGSGSVVLATSPTLVTPALGTPTSGTLTSCTGLPISTGVSGLGTGVATFLATPSSANLASAVTDETGSGALVFGTSPTIATPTITTSAVIPIVNGGTSASSTLTLQSTSGAGTSDAIIFKTASQVEAMRITTGGSVGIGTPSPAVILDLGGGTNFVNSVTSHTGISSTAKTIQIYDATQSLLNLVSGVNTDGAVLGGIFFSRSLGQGDAHYNVAGITALQNSTGTISGGELLFYTKANSSPTEKMRINVTGDIIFGNGESSATTTAATLRGPARTGTNAAGSNLTIATGNGTGTGGSGSLIFQTASAGSSGTTANTLSERMRIDSSGNVGIGTASPKQLLHVAGQGLFTTSTSSYDPGDSAGSAVRIGYNTGGDYGYVISSQTGVASKRLLVGGSTVEFLVSNAEKGRFNSDGKFGIGTTSPLTTLQVGAVAALNGDVTLSAGNNMVYASATSGAALTWNANTNGGYTNSIMARLQPRQDTGANYCLDVFCGTWNNNNSVGTAIATFQSTGLVGIGTASPNYKLEISTDSAGKPGVGGLWTVVSDERIKTDITPADLDRCYEIVKSVPLKHFGFAPGVYADDQINDKHSLGWIAQDVQKVFSKAVSVKPFTFNTEIPDGTEEYIEQDFTLETVEKTETSIQVIDGKPVQVSKVVTSEDKVLLFDSVDVVDEAGAVVMDGDKPLTYQMPRMVTKTRNKVRHDVIEDCLDLNGGQMIAALYGAVQALMLQVESLKARN